MVAEGFVVVDVFKLFGCTVCGILIPQPGDPTHGLYRNHWPTKEVSTEVCHELSLGLGKILRMTPENELSGKNSKGRMSGTFIAHVFGIRELD